MGILAIDDDHILLHTLSMVLEESYGEIHTLTHPSEAFAFLDANRIEVIILDMNFSIGDSDGSEGLAWIKKIHERFPQISIIVLTSHGLIELAVKALKQGAVDFLEKPFSNEKLISTVQAAINLANSRTALQNSEAEESNTVYQSGQGDRLIFGDSVGMQAILKTVEKVAQTEASLLITGGHGTGKELLARYIHQMSARAAEPFIQADLAAVTHSLFESTLFGHIKGAFTDASQDKTGLIEAANMGTLLLDEIGSLPLSLQSKLLAVLQNRELNRVGDNRARAVDIRLISTSHLTLEELKDSGVFRQDLLFRINTIHIHLPDLNDRKVDIRPLADHFLKYFNQKYDKKATLSKDDYLRLEEYNWPGNVRELKNTIERKVVMNEGSILNEMDTFSNSDNLYEVEKRKIIEIIERHSGNITHAAAELGIGRNTLYRKMRKYDL